MGKYLKMADVFVGEYKPKRRIDAWPPSKHGETLIELSGSPAQYAVHAINSHDELVENMQHYKQEAEQWEVRATKEASRVQDLNAEVERLRQALIDAATSLETIHVRSYGEDSFLDSKHEMRSYAGSRAKIARAALSEQ